MPSRRAVVSLVGATVSSGCSVLGPSCRWGVTVRATPADEVEFYLTDLVPAERRVVATAAENGSARATAIRGSPLRDGDLVSHSGAYYELRVVEDSTEMIPALRMDLHLRQDGEALGDVPVVEYEALPEVDRQVLDRIVNGPRWRPNQRLADDFTMGDVPQPYPNGTEDSRFTADETLWVRWDEETYYVHVRSKDTMERTTYRYEVTHLGTTRADVRAHLVPDDVVELDDLSDDQQAIMDQAIDEEHRTCEEEPAALKDLARRLGDDINTVRDTYVEYQGTVYEVSVQPWGRD